MTQVRPVPKPLNIPDDKPYFKSALEKQVVSVGESWSYTWPEPISDLDLDVTLNVTLGGAASFVHYNEDSLTLFINDSDTDEEFVGTYEIEVRLKDSNGTESAQTYILSLTLASR